MKKLLITVDSLRHDHLDHLEYTKNELNFDNKPAFATAASTYPSFPSILSGEYTSKDGVENTIADVFNVPTIGISSNHFLSPRYGYDSGFDYFSYPNKGSNWKSKVGNFLNSGTLKHKVAVNIWSRIQDIRSLTGSQISRDYNDCKDIISEFKQQKDGKDEWFAWLHFMEPHHPYNPPNVNIPRRKAKSISRKVISGNGSKEDKETVKKLYKKEIEYLDTQLKKLFRSISDQTQIIFCADHGEYMGENNSWGHGEDLVPELVQVPIGYKNIKEKPTGSVVSLIDVPRIITGKDYEKSSIDRDVAYATVNNKKAVFKSDSYKNEFGSFNYNGEEVSDEHLDRCYSRFDARSPSRMSEGVEEDLEALGYI